jgi:Ca2+-binding EF-hand superfamily protein
MVGMKIGLSALQKQKLTHLYHIFDVNFSGKLEQEDFVNVAVCLTSARGLTPGSNAHTQLKASLVSLWKHIRRQSDDDFDSTVSLSEWLRFFAHALHDDLTYYNLVRPLEQSIIDTLDTYGDGRISHRDYGDIVLALHLDISEVALLFRQIDQNRDGYITTDEAKTAISEFFLSSSENSPGNWFFGDYAVKR